MRFYLHFRSAQRRKQCTLKKVRKEKLEDAVTMILRSILHDSENLMSLAVDAAAYYEKNYRDTGYLDGLEAARRIRAQGHEPEDLPIVAMTANVFEEERKRAEAAAYYRAVEEHRRLLETVKALEPARDAADCIHPLYADAVKRLPYLEWWLEEHIEMGR